MFSRAKHRKKIQDIVSSLNKFMLTYMHVKLIRNTLKSAKEQFKSLIRNSEKRKIHVS